MRVFYGALSDLTFDPGNYRWNRQMELMNYMNKQGRQLIISRSFLARNMLKKWDGSLPHNFQLSLKTRFVQQMAS